jgi:hypothetical protein
MSSTTASAETFETPSGMGGSFTVSIIEALADGIVRVRVHYPSRDWDGYQFNVARNTLKATGKRSVRVMR